MLPGVADTERLIRPLTSASLASLAADGLAVPTYERRAPGPRIVHIGVGGFHRAHEALYVDELAAAGGDWRICGIGPLAVDRAMAEALHAQDQLYTLIEHGGGEPSVRVVGSIVEYRLAIQDQRAMIDAIARPETSIVSMTITESGYDPPFTSKLSVFDELAGAIERRMAAGLEPVTVLSCDNILHNGDVAREATIAAAHRRDAALADWIDRNCTFPNSMVDRITPATTDADRAWLREAHGIDDRWPVVAESFRQWVVEDRFASGRPRLEDVGVVFTDRVRDWETYKLRMLNATHTLLAYVAALAGIRLVDEALAVPALNRYARTFLHDEVLPSLVVDIPGHPAAAYAESVLDRFARPGIRDQIARLCIDGTVKFPTFIIPTVTAQLEGGGPIRASVTSLAAWARYLVVVPVAEQAHDAFAGEAREHAMRAVEDPLRFLDFTRVFPERLAANSRFRDEFVRQLTSLRDDGPFATVAAF
jgi:mannitol 2-dehydrogenase